MLNPATAPYSVSASAAPNAEHVDWADRRCDNQARGQATDGQFQVDQHDIRFRDRQNVVSNCASAPWRGALWARLRIADVPSRARKPAVVAPASTHSSRTLCPPKSHLNPDAFVNVTAD